MGDEKGPSVKRLLFRVCEGYGIRASQLICRRVFGGSSETFFFVFRRQQLLNEKDVCGFLPSVLYANSKVAWEQEKQNKKLREHEMPGDDIKCDMPKVKTKEKTLRQPDLSIYAERQKRKRKRVHKSAKIN